MRIAFSLVAVLFVQAAGCGDEFQQEDNPCEGVACNEDPWCCPSGQTCGSDSMTTFGCLNVGQSGPGEPCEKYVGIPGCGERLFCFTGGGSPQGVCVPFCDPTDPDRACPNYHHCLQVTVNDSTVIHVCDPNAPPG